MSQITALTVDGKTNPRPRTLRSTPQSRSGLVIGSTFTPLGITNSTVHWEATMRGDATVASTRYRVNERAAPGAGLGGAIARAPATSRAGASGASWRLRRFF